MAWRSGSKNVLGTPKVLLKSISMSSEDSHPLKLSGSPIGSFKSKGNGKN